ncbi:amidase signature domain-containing protein [Jimgerdemannia flammicorona]|uniref:Amidase signature domain-containing protein n=1 Tax=Jimgerdemannia flammicorona TaxID=994334 RepID=A0A433QF30_9FUNG|nr:amidase signature domain-containing protein [Jimgerdemannia flammicorona]
MSKPDPPVKRIETPLTRGFALITLTILAEWSSWLRNKLATLSGFYILRNMNLDDFPTTYPAPRASDSAANKDAQAVVNVPRRTGLKNSPYLSYRDFHEAYRSRKITPLTIAERLLSRLKDAQSHTPPLNHVNQCHHDDFLEQARESTRRYAEDRWLSELDGVPVLVKDEVDVKGYESRMGTRFMNKDNPAKEDATTVSRLRAKGALIVGKTVMNEVGWDVFSINPITGTPRNPFNPNHSCGGSSGGSAGAVAAGLVPISIGSDSGGSVRIPSSFCGLYGLKPTLGRMPGKGTAAIGPTNCTQGPLACSVDDLAIAYVTMGGPDETVRRTGTSYRHHAHLSYQSPRFTSRFSRRLLQDLNSQNQPPPTLHDMSLTGSLADLHIGIYRAWNAQICDPVIGSHMKALEQSLRARGATIVDIVIPDLETTRLAHITSLCSEACAYLKTFPRRDLVQLTFPNRLTMAISHTLTYMDYYRSLQIRTRTVARVRELFHPTNGASGVDLVLTPATAITAPAFQPRDLVYGVSNLSLSSDAMRYVFLANFAGLPALSAPIGFDDKGLPIGAQFMAEWWDEATLLRMARVCEELFESGVEAEKRKPSVWLGDLL